MSRSAARRLAAVLLVAPFLACASSGSASGGPRASRDAITQDQILERRFANALEVVQALRPNWLRSRGTDSFDAPSTVVVYYDEARLGGIEALRGVATSAVASMRHFDGPSAAARWGLDHGGGVIQVLSRTPASSRPPGDR